MQLKYKSFFAMALAAGITVSISKTAFADSAPPIVESFYSDSNKITAGGETTVHWKVLNATRVEIDGFVKSCDCELGLEDSMGGSWEKTTTITLRAYGANGEIVTQDLLIEVVPGPTIAVFGTTGLPYVKKGTMVTLVWQTENAAKCALVARNIKLSDRPVNGRITVSPSKTTTYTLIATDAEGREARKDFEIVVR